MTSLETYRLATKRKSFFSIGYQDVIILFRSDAYDVGRVIKTGEYFISNGTAYIMSIDDIVSHTSGYITDDIRSIIEKDKIMNSREKKLSKLL